MKYLLLFLIRCYWLIPVRYRNQCLFKESCSRHVYKTIKEHGWWKGIAHFVTRTQQCKPSYSIVCLDGIEYVLLADKSLVCKSKTTL